MLKELLEKKEEDKKRKLDADNILEKAMASCLERMRRIDLKILGDKSDKNPQVIDIHL